MKFLGVHGKALSEISGTAERHLIIPERLKFTKSTKDADKSDMNSESSQNARKGGKRFMGKTIDLKDGNQLLFCLSISFKRSNSRLVVLCRWILLKKVLRKGR